MGHRLMKHAPWNKLETKKKIDVAILGATGYTGSEILKCILKHPKTTIKYLIGNKTVGKKICEIFSLYKGFKLPKIHSIFYERRTIFPLSIIKKYTVFCHDWK